MTFATALSFQSSAFRHKTRYLCHGWPSHSQPHLQRVESLSLSFLRSALHSAHDLIHIVLLRSSHTMFDAMIVVPSVECAFLGSRRPSPRASQFRPHFIVSIEAKPFRRFVSGMPLRGGLVTREGRYHLTQPGRQPQDFRPGSCNRTSTHVPAVVFHAHGGMHTGRGRTVAVSLPS
jgi:hypothetical protein